MSNFYTFLKGIAATLLLLVAPATAMADYDSQLGKAVTDLSQLSADKTYAIYNDHFTTYMCYEASATNPLAVWAAGMIGDDGHTLTFTPPAYDATSANMAWLVSYTDGKLYIKNVGNGKYVKTQADNPGAQFTADESALEVVVLGDGKFAFHSSANGTLDFACCAPQLASYPIGWWESKDDGAAWQFIENPNVAVPVDAAPEALAGTYTVTTGAWSTSDADNFSVDSYPTTYTATISVDATGHALMKGFVGNPRKSVVNLETGVVTKTDSCYVGTWNEAKQTLTFTYPEGGYYMMNDEDYCNWALKAPFTLKATLTDGKYTLATTDDVSFLVNSAGYVATVAGVTFASEASSTPDPVVPDLPSGIDSEITLAELAGEYTATVDNYSIDETDAYYDDVKSNFSEAAKRTTFTVTLTVNEDGTAGLAGLIGDYNEKKGLGQYDVKPIPGVWDNDAKTLTFSPADVKNDYLKDEDSNKWRFDLTEPLVFKATVNVGTAHYELKADTLKFRFNLKSLTANTSVSANDVVLTSKFVYVVPEVEADPAPEDMAGTYKVTAKSYLVDDDTYEVPQGSTTTYATLTVKDGVALLSSLIGSASASSMDDDFNVVSKDTAYVGKYYAEAGTVEFNVPEGFQVSVPQADGYWTLQGKIIFKVTKTDDGLYTFTDGSACYKIDDDATVNVIGISCDQLAAVEFTKEDLIGKWNFAYEDLDEEADEETYVSKTSTFEIKEDEDGSLYMTNFLGTDTKEYPLTVTSAGISIKAYIDYSAGDFLIGNAQAVTDVDFLMNNAKTMTLASPCIYYAAEGGDVYATIKTGAVATKAAEEAEDTFDPAPADLAGRYTIATGAWTSDNDEEFPAADIATSYSGKITVDAEGKVLMTGLIGTPQSMSYDPATWDMTYTDSAYVGRYNAAAQTITFTFPASSGEQYWDIYDEATWQSWTGTKPFTVKVEKSEDGLYVLTSTDDISFSVSETYNVSCAGARFTQLKSYTMTADELVGKWQMKYAATDAYGDPTGEEAKTTFTIKKADDGSLVLTDLAGSSEELPITLTETGFSLPYTYEMVGDEMDGYYLMVTGNTSTGSDVTFYFSGNDTFTLETAFMFCNQANPEGVIIPAATVATRFVAELGEAVSSLDELSDDTAYVLYNPNDVVYAVYDEAHGDNIWAANVPGQTAFSSVAVDFDATADASSWMVVKKGDKLAIYNLGAKKYLTTVDNNGPCQFSDEVTLLSVKELGDGKFAFTSHEGNDYTYFCSAAAFSERPMTTWSSDDHGSSWQFVANPNVAADADIAGVVSEINTIIGNASAPAAIYTLGGVRLNATDPTKLQRGIYIVNGRKVIVK